MAHGFGAVRAVRLRAHADRLVNRGVYAPLFVTVATGERIVPRSAAERLARRLDHVEVLRLDCGHFGVYDGDAFERAVEAQAEFPERHL